MNIFNMPRQKQTIAIKTCPPSSPQHSEKVQAKKRNAGKGITLLRVPPPMLGYKRAKPFEMSGVGHDRHSVIVNRNRMCR